MDREAWYAAAHGVTKSGHDWVSEVTDWLNQNCIYILGMSLIEF